MNTKTMTSDEKLNMLRSAYAGINSIDPCGQAYQNLIKYLDSQSYPSLQALANANIKWVSALARNRLK